MDLIACWAPIDNGVKAQAQNCSIRAVRHKMNEFGLPFGSVYHIMLM